jgi:hypothetical protein
MLFTSPLLRSVAECFPLPSEQRRFAAGQELENEKRRQTETFCLSCYSIV